MKKVEAMSKELVSRAKALNAKIVKHEGAILELRTELGKIVVDSKLSLRAFEDATGVSMSSARHAKNYYKSTLESPEAAKVEAEKQKHIVTPFEQVQKLIPKLSADERKQLLSILNKG